MIDLYQTTKEDLHFVYHFLTSAKVYNSFLILKLFAIKVMKEIKLFIALN